MYLRVVFILVGHNHHPEFQMQSRPHAVVFPYPYQGHIMPTLSLAAALATRGFAVTFVFLDHVNRPDLPDCGLDIHYATISDGFPTDFDRNLNVVEFWEVMLRDFPARVDTFVQRIVAGGGDLFFLVADTLYTWPASIADKYGLVHVSFLPAAATMFTINSHLDLLKINAHFPYTGNNAAHVDYIPGIPSISMESLIPYIKQLDEMPIFMDIIVKAFEQVKTANFILCNTVNELESEVFKVLNRRQPTYAIGPTSFIDSVPKQLVKEASCLKPQSDCTAWLDSKPFGSVLYISFGSIFQIDKHEVEEMAHGLLQSRVDFLWVLKAEDGGDEILPSGFKDDVKDQGRIVPWCDQLTVLANLAVGGFVTHCGWNSVLESAWNGVPMICHPMYADQFTNRKLVVDDWKIGINLSEVGHIHKEEFAEKVDVLMKGEKCMELREEAKKVRKTTRDALGTLGSSHKNFERFVEELKVRLVPKRSVD